MWAAGVTYLRGRDARMEESKDAGGADFYVTADARRGVRQSRTGGAGEMLRDVCHLNHIGRTRTAGPLTSVTAKNSTTKIPSAQAIASDRSRRRFFCASVRTMPSGFRSASIGSCTLYQISGRMAFTTTSSSRMANSAKR